MYASELPMDYIEANADAQMSVFATKEAYDLGPAFSTGRLIWRHARQWVDLGDQVRALDAVAEAGGESASGNWSRR